MSHAKTTPLAGYSKKPLAITLIALAFLALPGVMLLEALMRSEGSWRVVGEVLGSVYFRQELLLSWSAAAAVFVVTGWSFAYLLLLGGYVVWMRIASLLAYPNLETPASLGVTAFWFGVVACFLGSTLKAPYLHPRLRWWTRPPRVALHREAVITFHGGTIPVVVWNLSRSGAFLKLDEHVADRLGWPQHLGEPLHFRMASLRGKELPGKPRPFTARAELVWTAPPESPYRYGLGIKFTGLSRRRALLLTRYLRDVARR